MAAKVRIFVERTTLVETDLLMSLPAAGDQACLPQAG